MKVVRLIGIPEGKWVSVARIVRSANSSLSLKGAVDTVKLVTDNCQVVDLTAPTMGIDGLFYALKGLGCNVQMVEVDEDPVEAKRKELEAAVARLGGFVKWSKPKDDIAEGMPLLCGATKPTEKCFVNGVLICEACPHC